MNETNEMSLINSEKLTHKNKSDNVKSEMKTEKETQIQTSSHSEMETSKVEQNILKDGKKNKTKVEKLHKFTQNEISKQNKNGLVMTITEPKSVKTDQLLTEQENIKRHKVQHVTFQETVTVHDKDDALNQENNGIVDQTYSQNGTRYADQMVDQYDETFSKGVLPDSQRRGTGQSTTETYSCRSQSFGHANPRIDGEGKTQRRLDEPLRKTSNHKRSQSPLSPVIQSTQSHEELYDASDDETVEVNVPTSPIHIEPKFALINKPYEELSSVKENIQQKNFDEIILDDEISPNILLSIASLNQQYRRRLDEFRENSAKIWNEKLYNQIYQMEYEYSELITNLSRMHKWRQEAIKQRQTIISIMMKMPNPFDPKAKQNYEKIQSLIQINDNDENINDDDVNERDNRAQPAQLQQVANESSERNQQTSHFFNSQRTVKLKRNQ